MGKLPGIQKLDFDCKTATLRMKAGASLSRKAATEALVKAGFGVTKIEEGEPPKSMAYLFRVTGVDSSNPALAQQALRDALDAPDFVAVDATGAAAVTLRDDKKVSEAELGDSLRKAGLGIEAFTVREWPKQPVVYLMQLQDVTDVTAATRARAALAELEKVVWVEVHPDRRTTTIFLNEPCNEIETNVRGALDDLGYGVQEFRLEK